MACVYSVSFLSLRDKNRETDRERVREREELDKNILQLRAQSYTE